MFEDEKSNNCVSRSEVQGRSCRAERGHGTVAANMRIWIIDSDIGVPPDQAFGPGPAQKKTLP